jgi:hypothetical protein
MKKILWFALALLYCGCFEVKEEIILNPDGSGKANVEVITVNADALMGGFGTKQKSSDASSALNLIEKSKGVDVWKDVTYGKTQDGRSFVKGTAYFADVNQLKIDAAPAFHLDRKNDQWTISMSSSEFNMDKKSDKSKAFLAGQASKEERLAVLQKEKQEFEAGKAMMGMFLSSIKMDVTIQVPGKFTEVSNFKKDEKGRLKFQIDGAKLMDGMNVFQDEKWLNDLAAQKKDIDFKDVSALKMNERLFGTYGEIKAVAAVQKKNIFDYALETAKAKEAYPALLESLGGKNKTAVAKGDGFSSVHAIGIQYSYDTEGKSFSGDTYKMTFLGQFSGGSVSEITEILFTKAVADNGENLLGEDVPQKVTFPSLSQDKTSVTFDMTMHRPKDDAKGLKEIAGTIEYRVSSGTKDIDLGFKALAVGAKGTQLGAVVQSIEPGSWGKTYHDLKLKLDIAKERIAEIKFYDKDHNTLYVTKSDLSESPDVSLLSFSYDGDFPPDASVVVTAYNDIKTYSAPFTIRDVDLFGRPLKK